MSSLFLYKNNCKSSKQVLDIFSLRKDNDTSLLCIDDLPVKKSKLIIEKYRIRDIPCIITDDKILYSSDMFSFVKASAKKNDNQFFSGYGGGDMFSQKFSSINEEELELQEPFHFVEGITGPDVADDSKQSKKGKGKKSSSETDRKYEEMMENRNRESKKSDKVVHNNRVDFSKPIYKI